MTSFICTNKNNKILVLNVWGRLWNLFSMENILRIVPSIPGEIFPNLVLISLKVCFLTLIQQWFSYYLIICISINRFFLLSWVSCLVTEALLHCHFLLYILKPFQFHNPLVASVYVSINPMYLYNLHNNNLSSTKK